MSYDVNPFVELRPKYIAAWCAFFIGRRKLPIIRFERPVYGRKRRNQK